jgi:uncharacterized protein with ParB-like and HNH nuclease domain
MALGNYDLSSINKILSNKKRIEVPFFQRSYSWKKSEQTQFFDDLMRVYDEKIKNYFIGSIFFREAEDNLCVVIDGQQRITTVTILIAVIRDILFEHNDNRAEKIETKFLLEEDLISQEIDYKLILNDINHQFFQDNIQIKSKASERISKIKSFKNLSDSNKLIAECYLLFNKRLNSIISKIKPEEQFIKLLEIVNVLTENFQALTVVVTDENEAFTIFETLNDRGLDLTISDLLKNYLFSIIYSPRNDSTTRILVSQWDAMVERLGKSIGGFFKHYWNSKNKPISEKEIFRVLKNRIKTKQQVHKFLKEIYEESEVYYYLLYPDHSYWNNVEVENILNEISILGIRQCLPVLLSTKLCLNESEFIKSLKTCVGLSFRYSTVCNLHNNKLEVVYSNIANEIRNEKIKTNAKIRSEFKHINPKDNIYDESFNELTFRNNKTPKYILKKINDSLDSGSEIISSSETTLEHIIPERPISSYQAYFKKEKINFKEVVYKLYNMTILGNEYNRQASSQMFDNKLVMYKKSKLPINDKLSKYSKWTNTEMQDWCKYLRESSKSVWKI